MKGATVKFSDSKEKNNEKLEVLTVHTNVMFTFIAMSNGTVFKNNIQNFISRLHIFIYIYLLFIFIYLFIYLFTNTYISHLYILSQCYHCSGKPRYFSHHCCF